MRKQTVARIKQFNKATDKSKQRLRPKLTQQYERLSKSLRANFEVPKLKTLIADPNSWSELKPVSLANRGKTAGSTDGEPTTLDTVVDEAYLRTLSRFPNAEETSIAKDYINESDEPSRGIEGLMWALVNTKEFIISH